MFIQDTPSKLDEVRKIIAKVDIPVRQVMIEARVVEASDKFTRNLGVNMTYNNTRIAAGGPPGGGGVAAAGVTAPVTAVGTVTAMLFNATNTRVLNLQLQALESDSKGKIISSPRVVTADKTEALIETGTEVPYLQYSSSGAANIAFKLATLSLKVKPQITPDDNVILDVKINKDSVGQLFAGVPSIDTNKVNTQVLVENGGTVVIGGVYTQAQTDGDTKVPWLGDIPILGYFFKSTSKIDNKNELLVFITPKIMKDTLNLK
jgi:type IV pilus assembly protein PilQ